MQKNVENMTFNYSPNFYLKKRDKNKIKYLIFHYTGMKNDKLAIKKLTNLNEATKSNLQNYLEQHRTLTDAVNIKNAFTINFSIQFEIIAFKSYSNQEVLLNCITELKDYFSIDKWQINQPIIISEIYNLIGGVDGVQSVEDVQLENKFGTADGYSQYKYDFNQATRKGVIYPSLDPSIFELKTPNQDIIGRVTTY